jgi:hypothetical protein
MPSPANRHNPNTSTVVTAPVNTRRRFSTCPAAANAAATPDVVATTANGPSPTAGETSRPPPGPASTTSRNDPSRPDDADPGMTDSDNEAPGYRRVS